MPTLLELYCARHGCTPRQGHRRIFWRTLHWHALPFVPLLLLSRHFESDRGLIEDCARAIRMRQIFDAINDHAFQAQNSGWLRQHANLRVSTRRLRKLAADYLPGRKAVLDAAPGWEQTGDESGVGCDLSCAADFPGELTPVGTTTDKKLIGPEGHFEISRSA